jgi:hypothetical protein
MMGYSRAGSLSPYRALGTVEKSGYAGAGSTCLPSALGASQSWWWVMLLLLATTVVLLDALGLPSDC